ncbi:hypothetical protein GGF38_003108, partial [Coemansia sp. RSA 25]
PKAARLLGLESPAAALAQWPGKGGLAEEAKAPGSKRSLGEEEEEEEEKEEKTPGKMQYDSDDTRGPLLRPAVAGGGGASQWAPEWPEPSAAYVERLMRRRPPPPPHEPPQHQALAVVGADAAADDDPLVVWQQPARLPAASGVPRGADNAWRRAHGLHLPVDALFAAQWAGAALLTGGYAAAVRPLLHRISGGSDLLEAAGAAAMACAHALSLAASAVDAAQQEARDVPRDLYFRQTWGTPVVDAATGVCRVCCVRARGGTRHCKRCNKCVAGMDHHCRWLNTCVGARNYWLFFASLVCALLALLFVLSAAARLVFVAATDAPRFARGLQAALPLLRGVGENRPEPPPAWGTAAAAVGLAAYAAVAAAGLVAVAMLLGLHVRLCAMRMTTFEYAAMKHKRKQQSLGGDDEELSEMVPMSALSLANTQQH